MQIGNKFLDCMNQIFTVTIYKNQKIFRNVPLSDFHDTFCQILFFIPSNKTSFANQPLRGELKVYLELSFIQVFFGSNF